MNVTLLILIICGSMAVGAVIGVICMAALAVNKNHGEDR